MKSNLLGSAEYFILYPEDVEVLRETGKIEKEDENLSGLERKVVFNLVEGEVKSGMSEEPGFHICAAPKGVPLTRVSLIEIYLSYTNFEKLISDVEGWFVSRCDYDRVNIYYYSEKVYE